MSRKPEARRRIVVIGTGPGDASFLPPIARQKATAADALVGSKRALSLFQDLEKPTFEVGANLPAVAEYLRSLPEGQQAGVLVSGDPLVFSLLAYLQQQFPDEEIDVVPGISSVQLALAKAGLHWDGVELMSLHGRQYDYAGGVREALRRGKVVAILTDATNSPSAIARTLLSESGDYRATVAEDLSAATQRVTRGRLSEIVQATDWRPAVMLIENDPESRPVTRFASPGIPDQEFERGKVPLTKEEVRTVAIAKLRLKEDSVVFDVGAGTGSMAIETALVARRGRVFAVEKDEEALDLIRRNVAKFETRNVTIVPGVAPDALAGLPDPDRVFVGGSGPEVAKLLRFVVGKLRPEGRVIVAAVTLDTLGTATKVFDQLKLQVDVVSISVSRAEKVGAKRFMRAQNQVYLIIGEKS